MDPDNATTPKQQNATPQSAACNGKDDIRCWDADDWETEPRPQQRQGETHEAFMERWRAFNAHPKRKAAAEARDRELREKEEREAEEHEARKNATRRKHLLEGEFGISRGVGPRYRDCTLDNYQCESPEQNAALKALRDFADGMMDSVRRGDGLILFGPKGTGKDHLMVALAKVAVDNYHLDVRWENGADIYGDVRDAMGTKRPEENIVNSLATPKILCISDPLPPSGPITPFQAEFLFRVLDRRYRECLPTWITCNVSGRKELEERLGAQNADRLIDGATAVYFNWQTHRKVREQGATVQEAGNSEP